MIKFQYDEKEYAENILRVGFITKRHMLELRVLVKYFKFLGYPPKKRSELIYKFCENHISGFNKIRYYKKINSILNYGKNKKNKLIIIKSIPITDRDMRFIENLDLENDYKKILFCLLVKHRLNKEVYKIHNDVDMEFNYFGGSDKRFKEIMQIAKLGNKYNIDHVVNLLEKKGLIEIAQKGKIKLIFIDKMELGGEHLFEVTTFDSVGYHYDYYYGDSKIIKCFDCGDLIKFKSNRGKYCNRCWVERERELWRLNKQKHRSVQV